MFSVFDTQQRQPSEKALRNIKMFFDSLTETSFDWKDAKLESQTAPASTTGCGVYVCTHAANIVQPAQADVYDFSNSNESELRRCIFSVLLGKCEANFTEKGLVGEDCKRKKEGKRVFSCDLCFGWRHVSCASEYKGFDFSSQSILRCGVFEKSTNDATE